MSCGCSGASACGCTIVGGDNVTVQQLGSDTFVISSTDTTPTPENLFIQQANPGSLSQNYLWIELLPDNDVKTFWIWA